VEPDAGSGSNRSPELFDEVATLYQEARPLYPAQLIDDLIVQTNLSGRANVLEIGCGTGQITVPLAQRGLRITAVEPGPNLAELARTRLSSFPDASVILDRFEDFRLPIEPFDLVVSATAFHWLDPAIRVDKAAQALKDGGHLVIIHTRWGVGSEIDPFTSRSQRCYERWQGGVHRCPTVDQVPTRRTDLDASPDFTGTTYRRYEQRNRYTTESFLNLLRTFSDIRPMAEQERRGLFDCLGNLIETEFSGSFVRTDLREMWIARKTRSAPG
jgi:SAM-dependent methyltransferase